MTSHKLTYPEKALDKTEQEVEREVSIPIETDAPRIIDLLTLDEDDRIRIIDNSNDYFNKQSKKILKKRRKYYL